MAAEVKKKLQEELSDAEIGGIISGVATFIAASIFFIYSTVKYVKSQDHLTFRGLANFMAGLCLEFLFRIRRQDQEAARPNQLAIMAP